MANVLVDESYLQGIANAIRTKNGSNNTYTPVQMATAIGNIPQSGTIISSGQTLLSDYIPYQSVSNGWFDQSQTVGNNINITGTNNTSWSVIKFPIQINKKYLCKTFFTDSGYPVFFVCDSNGKIIYSTGNQNKIIMLDTTGLDDTNGLYLYVAYGSKNQSYVMNNSFSTVNTVFVREILYPTTVTSLGDL